MLSLFQNDFTLTEEIVKCLCVYGCSHCYYFYFFIPVLKKNTQVIKIEVIVPSSNFHSFPHYSYFSIDYIEDWNYKRMI